MKRVVAVLLVFAVGIAAFVPVLGCPDCAAGAARAAAVEPGCPRCGDSGRISAFERVRRRPLDPDLAILVSQGWLLDNQGRFLEALVRLNSRSPGPLVERDNWAGLAVFAPSDDRRRVVALLRPSQLPAGPSPDFAILFDEDGAGLDAVGVMSAQGWLDLESRLERGGVVLVEAPRNQRPHRFRVARGSASVEHVGAALRLIPSGARFEIVVVP